MNTMKDFLIFLKFFELVSFVGLREKYAFKSFFEIEFVVCCIHAKVHSVYVCKMRFQNISKPARFRVHLNP